MNNGRRKEVKRIVSELMRIETRMREIANILKESPTGFYEYVFDLERMVPELEELSGDVTSVSDEEMEAFDTLPEGIKYSERGDTMEETIDELNDKECEIDDLSSDLSDVIDSFNDDEPDIDGLESLVTAIQDIRDGLLQIINK